MKYFAAAAALVSVIPGIVSLTINTPTSVVQCQPQLMSWSDGAPPFYLSMIPGGQPSATPLKTFDTQNGNSLTWTVDIAGGTSVTFALKDSTGATAYTDTVTIQKSSDSSCMGGGAAVSSPASSVDTSNTGNTPGNSNGSNSASAAIPTQAADASSSASGSTGTSRSVGGASSASSIRVTTSLGVGATQSRAVATTSAVASASASRAATTGTSGAESRSTATGFGFAGFVALIGAMFL